MRHRALALLLACALSVPAILRAAETGSISGRLVGPDGNGLPGVVVMASGGPLPAGRLAVTREDGTFQILRLPPGTYGVVAEVAGLGKVDRPVVVAVDRDTQVELTVSEEITVWAEVPAIDVRSAETGANFTQARIESLPVQRTYRGLFQLAPGVAENGRNTTPNAGGSRMDNNLLLDGVNVTNPHYGDIFPDVTELDIAEVNLKRSGITAEFGRTGGMVVNAVTRSGSNDLSGRVRVEYRPSSFVADSKTRTLQNKEDRRLAAASLGGPILRDRAWFYGSVNFPRFTTTDRANALGAVPDSDRDTDEVFLKLTAQPSDSLYVTAAARSRDTDTTNAGIASSTHPSVATTDTTKFTIATVTGIWSYSAIGFLEGRFNHDKEENDSVPVTSLGYRPAFDAARPDRMGAFTTATGHIVGGATTAGQIVGGGSLFNSQDFLREEGRLTGQSFLGWGGKEHDLRAGVSWEKAEERLARRANGWGNISFSTTTQLYTANYTSIQPPHTGRSETLGAFVQDQLTLGPRTTLMLGLLANHDVYYGEKLGSTPGTKVKAKILTFDWGQQIQPRLGMTFVLDPALGDRLFFSAGRYMNTENKSLTRAASPTRIFTTRATFDVNGNLISDVPAANTQNKKIDAGLDPMYTDEISAGYGRPLGGGWSAEVYGVYREVNDIFEDVSADGLGNGPFHVAQLPDAFRRYKAITAQVRRAGSDRSRLLGLWLDASYTWSRLEGNWDIDYADSLFFNSSILQDGPGVLVTDNRDGLLLGDRTHVAKVLATIEPWDRVRVGSAVRWQSGGAWEARAQPSTNVSSSYYRYLEPAGQRRMESWLNVDLLASYEWPLGPVRLQLEGRVTNLFDEQAELAVDQRYLLNAPLDPAHPGPSPLLSPSNNTQFGRPTQLSDPRAYVLQATLSF
jgi:hypothetical protein